MSDTESKDKNTIDVPPLHRGDLLISSPMLGDPNFSRTVILILDRDQDHGYIGLTLNRRMQLHLSDIFGDEYEENNDMTIFSGGPVDLQGRFWVPTLGEKVPGAIEVLPGIFVGGDLEAVHHYLHSPQHSSDAIRFYLGYSGWGRGQLEREIQGGAWQVQRLTAPAIVLTADQDALWVKEVRDLGPEFRHWLMLPPHPSLN